jgi:hypothetical protein
MGWTIAIITWTEGRGSLLIQTDDERLFTLTVDSMTPADIGAAIAQTFNIPVARVIYHDTKQTLYRRLTYMRFVVLE